MKRLALKRVMLGIFAAMAISIPSIHVEAQRRGPEPIVEPEDPDNIANDIIVNGVRIYDPPVFEQYILPKYETDEQQRYEPMDPMADPDDRGKELNRRRRIHDCIARQIAEGVADAGGLAQREVTFRYRGKVARFDVVMSTPDGVPINVTEVKTVLDYVTDPDDLLVRNQPLVAEGIINGEAVPVGDNAQAAGFRVDQPIGRSLGFTVIPAIIPSQCDFK